MAEKSCGAKTRGGGLCKRAPRANGRCNLHGGKTPEKNIKKSTPGSLYSKYMTEDEQEIAESLELGSVDEELRLTRIRLMRCLRLESERADTPELTERTEREGAENVTARMEEKFKVRDYGSEIDKLTARIESLESRRVVILNQQLDADLKKIELSKLSEEKVKTDRRVTKIEIEIAR